MRYMVFLGDGGKRLRPVLTMLACDACRGKWAAALPFAQAVEEIHTYTLIVDDIQDKSPLRRGEPTCHAKFGMNTALLAAARLYERGLEPFHRLAAADRRTARDLLDLLHRGQAADLAAETWTEENNTLANLRFIHVGKTSALLQLALLGGLLAARASQQQRAALLKFGYHLGMAFQVRDEILSVSGTTDEIGKPAGEHADEGRLTYPRLTNPNEARNEAERCVKRAAASLADADLREVCSASLQDTLSDANPD
jgi:geranylgeranyl pyrophosphate synthase